jgi:hypothetical protein
VERFGLFEKTVAAAQTKKATEPSFGSFKRTPAAQRSEPRERSDLTERLRPSAASHASAAI